MTRTRAVLLDALGTLLALEPPAPRLRAALAARLGLEVPLAACAAAVEAEIAFYRAHLHRGADAAGLAELRRDCAVVIRDGLGEPAAALAPDDVLPALLDAIRFRPFPDAAPALRALRRAGKRLVVLSNWDVSLHDALAATGLAALVDGALSSAEIGAAKPAPAAFARALALAGTAPEETLHVGDSLREDVAGARAAGLRALLVVRDGAPPPPGVEAVATLAELPARCR